MHVNIHVYIQIYIYILYAYKLRQQKMWEIWELLLSGGRVANFNLTILTCDDCKFSLALQNNLGLETYNLVRQISGLPAEQY